MRKSKLQVMLSDDELAVLDRLAAARGLSRSAYVRALILAAALSSPTIPADGGQLAGRVTTTPPHGDH